MIPVLAGLLAASGWAVSNLASRRAAEQIGTPSTVALSTSLGLFVCLPFILAAPAPAIGPGDLLPLAGAAFGGVIGLLFAYRAFRVGRVALVAPIITTQGAVAAVLAVAAGEALRPLTAAMLAVVMLGVIAVALGSRDPGSGEGATAPLPTVLLLASLGALCFGVGMFSTGRLAGSLSLGWAALPSRLAGAGAILLPLAGSRRLRLARAALPSVLLVGLADVGSILIFAFAAKDAPAVTSVFGSQTAVVSAIGALLVFRERPSRLQAVGLIVVALGAGVLAFSRA